MRYSISDFRRDMRLGQYAWPGGYQRYFIMSDGDCMSFEAARQNVRLILDAIHNHDGSGWRIVATDINYKQDLTCCDTGKPIPASYGVYVES